MYNKYLIFYILNIIFNLVLTFDFGDVSISPSKYFFKKRIFGSSVRPFLNGRNIVIRSEKTVLRLTTPIPSTFSTSSKPIEINLAKFNDRYKNTFDYNRINHQTNFNEIDQNDNYSNNLKLYYKTKPEMEKFDSQIDVVTYKSIYSDEEDNNIINNKMNKRDDQTNFDNYRPNYREYYKQNKINKIQNLNKTYYRIKIVDLLNDSTMNDGIYPIVKFVNQYKCNLTITTCGLYNDPQLKDMFYLEEIRDIYNRQRCFVADTSKAKRANMFGARLVTQYFHTFNMSNACLEFKYFANGPGISKMQVAQQDELTNVIWNLENYLFDIELSFRNIKSVKIPVILRKSEPRFFITVNLDPNKIGRIGILGFNFTYSNCNEL